jgi:hypothetical protein
MPPVMQQARHCRLAVVRHSEPLREGIKVPESHNVRTAACWTSSVVSVGFTGNEIIDGPRDRKRNRGQVVDGRVLVLAVSHLQWTLSHHSLRSFTRASRADAQ